MANLSCSDKTAAARLFAIQKWPWLRVAIFSMIPHALKDEDGTFNTFGITKDGVLVYSEHAVNRWSVEEIATVLVHEACHLLRNHAERREAIDPILELWGWAVDAEINDDMREAKWKFPDHPVFPEQFKLDEGLTAEEYYGAIVNKLEKKTCQKCGKSYFVVNPNKDNKSKKAQTQPGNQDSENDDKPKKKKGKGKNKGRGKGKEKNQQLAQSTDIGDQQDKDDTDEQENQSANGNNKNDKPNNTGEQCPSCGGHGAEIKFPDKPDATNGWCGSGAGVPLPDEENLKPKGVNGRTPVEQQIMRRQVAEAIKREATKGRGTVPADWDRWADRVIDPPKVNWRSKLARACRHTVARRAGAVDMSYHRPSRRQSGLGFGAGRAILPAYFTPVPKVAILVDTSGSMGDDELSEAVNESVGVMKAISADVIFAALDAAVNSFKKVRYPRELVTLLRGGGGTDFRVGFTQIEKLPLQDKPKIIVFITDGQGPAPQYQPKGIDVVWVLVGEYQQVPYCEETRNPITWGEQISIDDAGAHEIPHGV
jgi:predicted metal-dependent peptidase